jgi:hypothetical protein
MSVLYVMGRHPGMRQICATFCDTPIRDEGERNLYVCYRRHG